VMAALCVPAAAADELQFQGLLRARDLSPFGYLRLDMRPAYAATLEPGVWAIETEAAYQNTWAVSPEVERYLNSLSGRRELGPDEVQSIRNLPGENYLVDLELAQVDVALHYQFSDAFGAYVILSGTSFGGGFLDSTIEDFHRAIKAPKFGRPAVSRNRANLLFDLKSSQYVALDLPDSSGLLDPVVGVRYTNSTLMEPWKLTLESAIKIPIGDRGSAFSTGRTDFGAQLSLQRFWRQQAVYLDLAAVYYSGMRQFVPEPARVLPTLIVGYERKLTEHTNAIIQGYVSRGVYEREQTDLAELLGNKYQVSAGLRHRSGNHLITFAVTENLQNINNTPDIGFQLGWYFVPEHH
jgi:hypothetical protein